MGKGGNHTNGEHEKKIINECKKFLRTNNTVDHWEKQKLEVLTLHAVENPCMIFDYPKQNY